MCRWARWGISASKPNSFLPITAIAFKCLALFVMCTEWMLHTTFSQYVVDDLDLYEFPL